MEAGLATTPMRWPRRRPESRRRVEPRTMDMGVIRPWSGGPAVSIGRRVGFRQRRSLRQRAILRLDDPSQPDRAGKAGEADPEQHLHRRAERRGAAPPGDLTDQERADRGRDAADVVAEARAGAAQARREEL